MRETQLYGLSPEAKEFLKKNVEMVTVVCPMCKMGEVEQQSRRDWKDARDCGMFEDGPMLKEYDLKDGTIVREEVESAAWSSGPCIFLKLIDVEGKTLFEWGEKRIEENM